MTMPTTTTQDAVITDLIDGLLALGMAEVTFSSAPFDLALVDSDQCAVLDIPDGDETWYGLGNLRRQEVYTIRMACLVVRTGSDEETIRTVRSRAYEIHNVVAGYVRENPHLSGVTIRQLSGTTLEQGYDDDSRWARLNWGIRVEAQIAVV